MRMEELSKRGRGNHCLLFFLWVRACWCQNFDRAYSGQSACPARSQGGGNSPFSCLNSDAPTRFNLVKAPLLSFVSIRRFGDDNNSSKYDSYLGSFADTQPPFFRIICSRQICNTNIYQPSFLFVLVGMIPTKYQPIPTKIPTLVCNFSSPLLPTTKNGQPKYLHTYVHTIFIM